jgi:hypothetical protein
MGLLAFSVRFCRHSNREFSTGNRGSISLKAAIRMEAVSSPPLHLRNSNDRAHAQALARGECDSARFRWGKEPLVQSATGLAPDGRAGILLANCTDQGESPRVELRGQGNKWIRLYIDGQSSEKSAQLPIAIDIDRQPRSLSLIEV